MIFFSFAYHTHSVRYVNQNWCRKAQTRQLYPLHCLYPYNFKKVPQVGRENLLSLSLPCSSCDSFSFCLRRNGWSLRRYLSRTKRHLSTKGEQYLHNLDFTGNKDSKWKRPFCFLSARKHQEWQNENARSGTCLEDWILAGSQTQIQFEFQLNAHYEAKAVVWRCLQLIGETRENGNFFFPCW